MATIDLHSKPFDDSTITKLEIFEDYAKAWIPTFVMQPDIKEIHVFDFFAGPGYDNNYVPGSPIRILNVVLSYLGDFFKTKTKIVLHFNEYEPQKRANQVKYDLLVKNCDSFLDSNPRLKHFTTVKYYNEDAGILFDKLYKTIKQYPALVYLDQNGIRFISKEFINRLEQLNTTDFIYYVSSSYIWRFGNTKEFKKIIDFDMATLRNGEYHSVHRYVISKIKEELPLQTNLKLFPFTLKKGTNIFGIIFGAKHYRAVDKFLDIAWKRNSMNGEADFDIDNETPKAQLDLFFDPKMSKIDKFQKDLKEALMEKKLICNNDVLLFTYENGHIPKHATEIIKVLKNSGILSFEGRTSAINYDNVFKKRNKVDFKISK
jgi:three-Cys-motif partner protein